MNYKLTSASIVKAAHNFDYISLLFSLGEKVVNILQTLINIRAKIQSKKFLIVRSEKNLQEYLKK